MARTNTKTRNRNRDNAPAYIAYHVPERENAPWQRIGAAWTHSKGDGLTLQLDLVPVGTGRVVLRAFDPDAAEAKGEER